MQDTVDRHASSDWCVVPDVIDTLGAPGRVAGFAQSATRRHIGRRLGTGGPVPAAGRERGFRPAR